jgi:hypothetical protein
MKTIVGLFSNRENIEQASHDLISTGLVDRPQIQVLTSADSVKQLLAGHQSHLLLTRVGLSLFASLLLFGLYNLIGLACHCSLIIFDMWIELDVLFLIVGGGVLITSVITYFFQVNRLNGSFRPYTYNTEHGSLVMAVEAPPEQQQAVVAVLYQHHGSAIKTLETRFSAYWRKKSQPMEYQR